MRVIDEVIANSAPSPSAHRRPRRGPGPRSPSRTRAVAPLAQQPLDVGGGEPALPPGHPLTARQQAAAHVGVEGLALDTESLGRVGGAQQAVAPLLHCRQRSQTALPSRSSLDSMLTNS